MAFFLFFTALVQGAENKAVLAIRVEGCGKGIYELKPDILAILQDVSGESNITWEKGVCKHHGKHHHGEHHEHREELRAFCANATNATNATGDKEGCTHCERCAGHCLEACEGEVAECLASEAFATCHGECLAKNMSGKSMGSKFGKKHGGKREGGKPMGGKFGDEREGDFGKKHGGEKPKGDFHKPMLAFAASEEAAAQLETPESREVLQARVCELLSAANRTKNATKPCVVVLERPQCGAEGFPVIAVSGIAGAAVVLIAFVAGCRSIRRRRSARMIKNGVVMQAADLEAGVAAPQDAPSKTRDSDLLSEASTSCGPTTVTTVPGGVGAPMVARGELRMA